MSLYLFRRGNLLDPNSAELREGVDVLVEGERIKEVSDKPIRSESATVIDVAGRTVMPGLIDAHVHVYLSEVNLHLLNDIPLTLMAGRAATLMRAMLDRGFTTVRDAGGAN
ncbi:MAG: amidohydrolase family protein [Alphaproteobacteria bacterium]|nr:amidohydrolase family protein [Alphaproteobacteria bacterium]